MREKIRNNIFKIDTDIKNLLTELGEKSLQTLRNAISNGQNNTEQMIRKLSGMIC